MGTFLLVTVAWVFSLCLHEYAHARVALAGGDTTVVDKGYLSMNPLRYMHPFYSIVLPLVFLAMGGIGLPGGAVYIDERRLRSKWWNSAVSAAGPLANAILAVAFAIVLRELPEGHKMGPPLAFICMLQVTAVVFNLLPIPPLDGYGALAPFLPRDLRAAADRAGRWTIIILFILLWNPNKFSTAFWSLILDTLDTLGVSRQLVRQGLEAFMFWKSG
jgi:Zn-dependent protease